MHYLFTHICRGVHTIYRHWHPTSSGKSRQYILHVGAPSYHSCKTRRQRKYREKTEKRSEIQTFRLRTKYTKKRPVQPPEHPSPKDREKTGSATRTSEPKLTQKDRESATSTSFSRAQTYWLCSTETDNRTQPTDCVYRLCKVYQTKTDYFYLHIITHMDCPYYIVRHKSFVTYHGILLLLWLKLILYKQHLHCISDASEATRQAG